MSYVFAVLGLGALCAAWVLLQLKSGEQAHGAQGECGACSHERECKEEASADRAVTDSGPE